jgi:hypothetical protein
MKKLLMLSTGVSDFEKAIRDGYYYVDKSLFIKEIIDNGAEVTLIIRPRRFGKTLNLSMLKCFFEKTESEKTRKDLFKNLNISKEKNYKQHQETYPVIFLTFKDVKDKNWERAYENIKILISKEFERHSYLLKDKVLSYTDQKDFTAIIERKAEDVIYKNSLKNLSEHLYRFHQIKPIILIDEYDSPIHEGFLKGYYDDAINFMRTFLGAGLKDNSNLKFAVITGILRVSKESIFSDLNNIEVCSFLDELYSDKFGLTEKEVKSALETYNLTKNQNVVKEWYNGYTSDRFKVYNPWSIINYLKKKRAQPYWVNTSGNDIIKRLMQDGDEDIRDEVENLIMGGKIKSEIVENIIFPDLIENETFPEEKILWSFLFFTGYLTYEKFIPEEMTAEFYIPNSEIKHCYKTMIKSWFNKKFVKTKDLEKILENLVAGNVEKFEEYLNKVLIKCASSFDTGKNNSEAFYHGFVLNMLINLESTHKVKSNWESGFGRCDIMIIPKDKKQLGIILELKDYGRVREPEEDTEIKKMKFVAEHALKQIDEKKYDQELVSYGIKKILKMALVFKGKKVVIQSKLNF